MLCPNCGKKTIFDWNRCPSCGADPWNKSGEALASATNAPSEAAWSSRVRRVARFYGARPALPRLFLVVGSAQVAYVLLVNAVQFVSAVVRGEVSAWPFGWLYDLSVAATPGLVLLAVGEALAQLGRIADGLRKS